MTLFDILKPEDYPLYITLPACIVLLLLVIRINYRRNAPQIAALFFIGSFIFMHLDLATYNMSYPFMMKMLAIFNLENMPHFAALLIKIAGYLILTVLPFFVWLIPMVMLDEQLCENIKESDDQKFYKTLSIAAVGIVVNLFFA
ncbi:MAG: hypothetical protein Q4A75_07290, partial [Peptostreptococcaceae bacterium]|nr:hypothetical protein [Peptostreptococcaceae bacterium]